MKSSNSQACEQPTEPQGFNIASLLAEKAREHPYKRAVVYPVARDSRGRMAYAQLTFRQLDKESDTLAHSFKAAGLTRGLRTILMVRPGADFFVLTFALFKAGAVPVVVDPGMGIGRMLACYRESRPEAFIGIAKAHLLRLIFPGFFKTVRIWITAGRRWFWSGHSLAGMARQPWRPFSPAQTKAGDPAAILFTTGSTGPAKGAVYTHGNFAAQIRHIQAAFGIGADEIDLPTFPLFALFDPALGMTAVIPDMDPTQPGWVDPEKIIEPIVCHGITNMFASPALLDRVGAFGREKAVKLTSLRRVVSAGAPVRPASIHRFTEMLGSHAQIHTPYGATEAVPVTTIGSDEILSETRPLSEKGYGMCVGRPLEGIGLRIIAVTDKPIDRWADDLTVSDGDIGEIVVRGDLVTRHYFENPQADTLAKIIDADGFWHRMGDLGWRDTKGRIWFCGRKSHRVVTAHQTLYTIPCEAIFNAHPQVLRSALVGIGPMTNQTPVICIELIKEKTKPDLNRVRQELLDLGKASVLTQAIRIILFHPKFPVDIRHNAKIFREKLAAWAEEQVRRKREAPDDSKD
jgi:acyl-CoA synthetase (AMP-forming)/AMP-acid ligase II